MDRLYWALLDSVVGYLGDGSAGDYSDSATIVIAGDSLAPVAPTFSVSPRAEAIELVIYPPLTNADGTTCVDFKEYGIYYSYSGGIDISDSATYEGLYSIAGSKSEPVHHTHATQATTYFVVTAYDNFGNQSAVSAETSATPDAARADSLNIVPNPFFSNDGNGDGIPDDWSLQAGWERSDDSYVGEYSIRGQGAGVSATSSKVEFPSSNRGLLVSGMAKTTGVDFSLNEVASTATTSAPIAWCDASGDLAAIARQNSSYDIIELWTVSSPASPVKVGSIDESGSSKHRSKPFRIYGSYLLCGNQADNELYIYDISDPTSPVLRSTYELENAEGRLAALAVRDWVAYACCDDDTNGSFIESVDITNPSSPVQLDVLTAQATAGTNYTDAAARNGYLAVIAGNLSYTSPTSADDPFSEWANEANSYDDNAVTYSIHASMVRPGWGGYIELTVPAGTYNGIRFLCTYDTGITAVDVEHYDGSWRDATMVTTLASSSTVWQYASFADRAITKIRLRFYNNTSNIKYVNLYEAGVFLGGGFYYYDVSDPAAMVLKDTLHVGGASYNHLAMSSQYSYVTSDAGRDVDKIVVIDHTISTNVQRQTAVGGAGSANYTGSDALFMSNAYLVNVGAGSDAAKYAVSYWDISAPDAPVLKTVKADLVGDLDAADDTGGLIVGVDVDNSKVKAVDPQIAADWEFRINFYDASETLIESITVYDGDADIPYTGESWTAFSQVIPEADIPNAAKKVGFVCYCNESTGYVYVDSLSAEFET